MLVYNVWICQSSYTNKLLVESLYLPALKINSIFNQNNDIEMFTTVQFVERILSYSIVKLLEVKTYKLIGLLMVIQGQH